MLLLDQNLRNRAALQYGEILFLHNANNDVCLWVARYYHYHRDDKVLNHKVDQIISNLFSSAFYGRIETDVCG